MAMKLNIQKFSGAGTAEALRQAQKISDNYSEVISAINASWSKIDSWSSANASGETLKKRVDKLAEFLNGIPEPSGNNANQVLRQRTDKIINDANYEDQVNNDGQAQVSNPFQEQHLSCAGNVPNSRAYNDIQDFRGLTDEGVATIDTFNTSLNDLESKVSSLFDLMGQGSVGTHVTGLDLTASYKAKTMTDKETLSENVNSVREEVNQYTQQQEDASRNRSEY